MYSLYFVKNVKFIKKQFDKNIGNETIFNAEESFLIEYFLYIVDKSLGSIESRFEQFKTYDFFWFFV